MPVLDQALRDEGHDLVLLPDGIPEGELAHEVADADLILMCYTPITRKVINSAPNLRGIIKYGVGIDAIDIPAAMERGIPVVNVPEYAEETVAEGAFALMIALAKKLTPLDRTMKRDGWAWPTLEWLATDIAEKTVGIVGLGRIGKSFARMAGKGFRARVIAYDPGQTAQDMAAHGVEKFDDLHALLRECDFLSIHATLGQDTQHLIGADELAMLKRSAVVINVARGALVDELALRDALVAGRIAGAGLDTFSNEPLCLDGHPLSPLFKLDNVILMPHLAFYSVEAMERLEQDVLARCREIFEGRPVTVKSSDPRLRAQTHGVTLT